MPAVEEHRTGLVFGVQFNLLEEKMSKQTTEVEFAGVKFRGGKMFAIIRTQYSRRRSLWGLNSTRII